MRLRKGPLKTYLCMALSIALTFTCITPISVRAATSGPITVEGNASRDVTVDKTLKKAQATYNINLSLKGLDASPSSSKKNVVIAIDWTSDSEENIKNAIKDTLIPLLRNNAGVTHLNLGIVSMESGHARTRLTSTLRMYGLKGEGIDINRNLDNIKRAVDDSRPDGDRNLGDGLRLAYSNVKAGSDYVEDPPNGYNPNEYDKYVVFVGGGNANYYTSDRGSGYYYGTGEDGQGMTYLTGTTKGETYFKDIADKIYQGKTGGSTVEFTQGDQNIKTFMVATDVTNDSAYNYVAGKLSTTLKKASGTDSYAITKIFNDIANSILYKESSSSVEGSNISKAQDIASKITIDEYLSDNLLVESSSLNGIVSSTITNGVKLSNLPIKKVVYNSTTKAYDVSLGFSVNYILKPSASGTQCIIGKDNLSKVNVSDITSLPLPEYRFSFDTDVLDSVTREVEVDKTNKKVNATYTIDTNIKATNQGEIKPGSSKKNIVIAVDWTTTSKNNVINAIQKELIPTIEASNKITNLNLGVVSMESGHTRTRLTSGLKLYSLKGGGRDFDRNYDNITRALVDSRPDGTRNLGDGLRLSYSNVKAGSANVVSYPSGYNPDDYDKYVIFIGSGDPAYYTSDRNDGYYYGTVSDGSGLTCLSDSTKGKAYFKDIADKINISKAVNGDVAFTVGDKNIKSYVVGTGLSNTVEYDYVAGKIGTTLKKAAANDANAINTIFKGIANEIISGSTGGTTTTPPSLTTLSSSLSINEYISTNLKVDTSSLNGVRTSDFNGGVKFTSLPIQKAVYNASKNGYDVQSKFTVTYDANPLSVDQLLTLGVDFKSNVNINDSSGTKTIKMTKYEFTFDDAKRINISNNGNEVVVKYKVKPGKESVGNDSSEIAKIRQKENTYGVPQGEVIFEEFFKNNLAVKSVTPISSNTTLSFDNSAYKIKLNSIPTEYKVKDSGDIGIYRKGTSTEVGELEFDVVYTLNGYYPYSLGSKPLTLTTSINSYALYEKDLTKSYKQNLSQQEIGVNKSTLNSLGLLKKTTSTSLASYVDTITGKVDLSRSKNLLDLAILMNINSQIPDVRVVIEYYDLVGGNEVKMNSSVYTTGKLTNITAGKVTLKGVSNQYASIIRVKKDSFKNFILTNGTANDSSVLLNGAKVTQKTPTPDQYLVNLSVSVPSGADVAKVKVLDEYGQQLNSTVKQYQLIKKIGSGGAK